MAQKNIKTSVDEKKLAFIKRNEENFQLIKKWFKDDASFTHALNKTELFTDNTHAFTGRLKIELKEFAIGLKSLCSIFTLFNNWHDLSFQSSLRADKINYLKNGGNRYVSNSGVKGGVIFVDGIKLLSNTPEYLQDDYVFFHEISHLLQIKSKSLVLNIESKPIEIFNQVFHSVENTWHDKIIKGYRTLMLEAFCDILSLYLLQKKNQLPNDEFKDLISQVMSMRTSHNELTHNTTEAIQMALATGYFEKPFESILEATYRISLAFTYKTFENAINEGVVFTNTVKKVLMHFDESQHNQENELHVHQNVGHQLACNQKVTAVDIVQFSHQFFFYEKNTKIYPFNNFNQIKAREKLSEFKNLLHQEVLKLTDLSTNLTIDTDETDLKAQKKRINF
jgi:hypothetical protein